MIWLIGAQGMLGQQIAAELTTVGLTFAASDREVDITNLAAVQEFAKAKPLHWIINCAAYTAVDKAEAESKAAYAINDQAVANLACIARQLNAVLIHFSTDFVFDGELRRPYREEDPPNPLSIYGASKLAGEKRIVENWSRYYIFRLSWLYGEHGANFVKTVIRLCREKPELRIVNDQIGSPTSAAGVACNIVRLIQHDPASYGLYHLSDLGAISWFDFAVQIQELALAYGILPEKRPIHPILTADYPTPARRPAYSVLDKTCVINRLGAVITDWSKNLEAFFDVTHGPKT